MKQTELPIGYVMCPAVQISEDHIDPIAQCTWNSRGVNAYKSIPCSQIKKDQHLRVKDKLEGLDDGDDVGVMAEMLWVHRL